MSIRKQKTKAIDEATHQRRKINVWLFVTQCSYVGHIGENCAFCNGTSRKALPETVRVLNKTFELADDTSKSPEALKYNSWTFIRLGEDHAQPVYWQKLEGDEVKTAVELKEVAEAAPPGEEKSAVVQ